MSDQTQQDRSPEAVAARLGAPVAPAPQAPAPADTGPQQAPEGREKPPVPYQRFEEVNGAKNALQAKVDAMEQAEAERQRAAMSELERAQQDALTRQREAEQAASRATQAERSLEIWKAAHAAGFRVPDDAVTFLSGQIDGLDSPEKLRAAVDQLAKDRTDLVGPVGGQPTPIGGVAAPSTPTAEVPLGADGKPDMKLGLGQDLLGALTGRR